MKRFLIPIILVFLVTGYSCQLNAQKDKVKQKTVTLKIEKETDEGKTMIDTTFTLKDGEDLDKILEQYGVKANFHERHKNAFDIDIETDDSIGAEGKMVWVSVDVDDDVHKTKIKNKHKQVVFISDDDDDNHNVIIRKGHADNDSVEVIVKKIKKGKHKKHVYITTDNDFTWNTEEDVHFESKDGKMSKVKVEIVVPTKEDLKILKIKYDYNKLDISNFFLFLNKEQDKMNIKFTTTEKGSLSVKIFDQAGKVVFNDDKKQFEGKYENETKALKGNYLIQINQGKKYFVRKLMLDWK